MHVWVWWGLTCIFSRGCLILGSVCRCQVQLFWTCSLPHPPPAFLSLSELPCRSQDGFLWDRHRACLRLSPLLPCGSHWKQMVSKQPVMFTAASIKDKSPTTHSLRRTSGSHRALQTAALGGWSCTHTYATTRALNWLLLSPNSNAFIRKHSQVVMVYWHKNVQEYPPSVLHQTIRTCYIYCN